MRYARLNDYIDKCRHTPFAWGLHDCVTFILGAIDAQRGVQTGIEKYITWKSEEESDALLKLYGDTLADVMQNVCGGIGVVEVDKAFAQKGDIVIYIGIAGQTCGVCIGNKIAVPGTLGLIYLPMKNIEML